MEIEQGGRFSFSVIFDYLKDVKYPEGFTKNDKRALRKRAAFFCIKETNLYYIGGKSSSSYRYRAAWLDKLAQGRNKVQG